MGVLRPDLMMKCIVPVVMAGIIAVSRNSNLLPSLLRRLAARVPGAISTYVNGWHRGERCKDGTKLTMSRLNALRSTDSLSPSSSLATSSRPCLSTLDSSSSVRDCLSDSRVSQLDSPSESLEMLVCEVLLSRCVPLSPARCTRADNTGCSRESLSEVSCRIEPTSPPPC